MFSNATISDVMTLLGMTHSHSDLDKFVFKYGLGDSENGGSKSDRTLSISKYLVENKNTSGILSDKLLYEVVEYVIESTVKNSYYYDSITNEFQHLPQLRSLLLKDGFIIENGQLKRTIATDIDFNNKETLLESLLDKHNLEIAKGHYRQSQNAFNRKDWAACNGQLRSYVEALFINIAEKITGESFTDSQQARIKLSQCSPPIFYKGLNEWLDNGTGFFETFWKRLHPEGSHPGLSSEDDSMFRLNLVLITTLEILQRFDKNYG